MRDERSKKIGENLNLKWTISKISKRKKLIKRKPNLCQRLWFASQIYALWIIPTHSSGCQSPGRHWGRQ